MDLKKQNLLLSYLISSGHTFAMCEPILEARYFDPQLRNTVTYLKAYYQAYNAIPSVEQIHADTGNVVIQSPLSTDQVKYCINEVESFCRRKAIEQAVLASGKLIQEQEFGEMERLIKNAVAISVQSDLGISVYTDGVKTLEKIKTDDKPQSTGYPEVDELLGGGLYRKQTVLVSANSGGGKSVVMANIGLNLAEQFGLNVLYITLELSEEMVWSRFATMLSAVPSRQWRETTEHDEMLVELFTVLGETRTNQFRIKRLKNGSTCNDIRAYLKHYEVAYGHIPDAIIVDYMGRMTPVAKVDLADISQRDKAISEEIYEIGNDYNAYMISASQQNREGVKATFLDQSIIAGGLAKIDAVDVYISIVLTDAMRNAGRIMLQFLKTRSSDGIGKSVTLGWSTTTLRMTNDPGNATQKTLVNMKKPQSTQPEGPVGPKTSLLDLME